MRQSPPQKVLSVARLVRLTRRLRRLGRRVVFTNGCFDLLHLGHVRYLQRARALGDCLVVGMNSDRSVRALKGPGRPLVAAEARAEVLAALAAVDYVTIFDASDPGRLITRLQPDILVKGADWRPNEIVGRDVVEARGGLVRTIPLTKGTSTTRLVAKIMRQSRRQPRRQAR